MSVPIQPLGDYVLLQPDKAEERTASGLYLTKGAQEKPDTAVVIAVGKEAKKVKPKDRVVYIDKYDSSKTVKIDKEEYVLIDEQNIVGIVK